MKRIATSLLALLMLSLGLHAQDASDAEQDARNRMVSQLQPQSLGRLIESLLTPADEDLAWSIDAGADSKTKWLSNGVESKDFNHCGIYEACRKGIARVLVDGKELHNLGQTIQPVPWDIFVATSMPQKFGPEFVEVQPRCDTVACTFDFKKDLSSSGFSSRKLCESNAPQVTREAYVIAKAGKIAILVYDTNSGSGGNSNSLKLLLGTSTKPADVCKGLDS